MPKRGKGFSKGEIDHLLEIIEDICPIGPGPWERVAERHILLYPNLDRTKDSLRKKFASLYNNKIPTGDPRCPANVRKAKHIYRAIQEKMELTDGGGSDDDYEDEEEDDDNEDEEEEEGEEEAVRATGAIVPLPVLPAPNFGNFTFSDEEGDGGRVRSGERRTDGGEEKTEDAPVVATTKKVRRASSFSTPVVKKCLGNNAGQNEDDLFDSMMKYMMMQRQMEIEAENRRRDRDDALREKGEKPRKDDVSLKQGGWRQGGWKKTGGREEGRRSSIGIIK